MQVNHGLVFWGVGLVTAGLVALAIQGGVIDPAAARSAWRLWPLVLIVIGLAIVAARTPLGIVATLVAALVVGGLGGTLVTGVPDGLSLGCGGDTDERVAESGSFAEDGAEVDLDLSCGEVRVAAASGTSWDATLAHGDGEAPTIESSDRLLRVEANGGGVIGFADVRQSWNLTIPTDVPIRLSLGANAASTRLELDGADLDELSIDANAGEVVVGLADASADEVTIEANAGSVSIVANDETTLDGSISMNAGSLEVCVPEGARADLILREGNVTFSHNLDDLGLMQTGDTWRWGDGEGEAAIVLAVDGNATSFTLNPDGGCA